jgi:hypothetical protein
MALAPTRLPQTQEIAGAIDITAFKVGGAEAEVGGGAAEIVFGQINVTLHLATARTAGYTRESQFAWRILLNGARHEFP